MTAPAVKVVGLEKSFGQKTVLAGFDLEIQRGSVFCLLGPNGAGKTTTVHILSTLLEADGGEARICGFDVHRQPERVRGMIGVRDRLGWLRSRRLVGGARRCGISLGPTSLRPGSHSQLSRSWARRLPSPACERHPCRGPTATHGSWVTTGVRGPRLAGVTQSLI